MNQYTKADFEKSFAYDAPSTYKYHNATAIDRDMDPETREAQEQGQELISSGGKMYRKKGTKRSKKSYGGFAPLPLYGGFNRGPLYGGQALSSPIPMGGKSRKRRKSRKTKKSRKTRKSRKSRK